MNLPIRGAFWNFRPRLPSRGRKFLKAQRSGRLIHRPSEVGIVFTACLMRHLILVFTKFHNTYKVENVGQFLILISISSDYLFTKHKIFQRGPIIALVNILARGQFARQAHHNQKLYLTPPANAI